MAKQSSSRRNYGDEVKWIAISTNIFDDEKIKLIERMPEGDTILIIWFKLLIKAGRINNGGYVYISEAVPYTEETMSYIFDRPVNTIRLALQTFQQLGMITISDTKTIFLKNWYKYQKEDTLQKIREQGRKRQEKFRQNQALKLLENNRNVTCNVTKTSHNALHDITLHDNTIHEHENVLPNNTCSSCSNEYNSTTTTENAFSDDGQKLYGEFGNVCLTKSHYQKLLALTLSEKYLNALIEDLSSAIAEGKELPYKADYPDAHFSRLKKYFYWRKTHPGMNINSNGVNVDEQVEYNKIVDSW